MDRNHLRKLMRTLRKADVTHVKVELEANFNRGEDDSSDCFECDGRGDYTCGECDGHGFLTDDADELSIDCEACAGSGYLECATCDGHGVVDEVYSDFSDVDYCHQYILDRVDTYARNALTYSRFYYDGSVDSELTFTLPVERIQHIPKFIRAFQKIGDKTGHCDVSGAGMHIAVLPDGVYPSETERFDEAKMDNFIAQNQRLLPALFFLGTANAKTRDLRYRQPRVSSEERYSAIYTMSGRAIEYRIFDTCYDKPEMVFDYLAVIANTLRYYIDPELQAPRLFSDFTFSESHGDRSLARFYKTKEKHLRILEQQLPLLKPEHKTVGQVKRERNFKLNAKTIRERRERRKEQLLLEVRRYVDNIEDIPTRLDLPMSRHGGITVRV